MRGVFALLVLVASLSLLGGCGGGDQGQEGAGTATGRAVTETPEDCLRRAVKPTPGDRAQQPDRKGLKNLHLTLQGYPDAEDAGILLAAQRGYFAAVGIALDITSPVITSNVPGYVAERYTDLGLLPQPQVTIASSTGMPLLAIGSVVRRPTMAMMWLKGSGIDGISDLKGKTVGINSLSFEEAVLKGALAKAGLTLKDVKLEQLGYELAQALAAGRVDAILGVSPNVEGVELEACGLKPIATPVRELGVPPYEELDVVVRRDRLAQDSGRFRAFMSALARGNAAAVADPRAAAEAITSYRVMLDASHPQAPALVQAKVKATLPLLSTSGSMSPAHAAGFAAWLQEQGLIDEKVPVSQLLTNRFVRSGS